MVVHYPRTVWKNSYAEHEVAGKSCNKKKVEPWECQSLVSTMTKNSDAEHRVAISKTHNEKRVLKDLHKT